MSVHRVHGDWEQTKSGKTGVCFPVRILVLLEIKKSRGIPMCPFRRKTLLIWNSVQVIEFPMIALGMNAIAIKMTFGWAECCDKVCDVHEHSLSTHAVKRRTLHIDARDGSLPHEYSFSEYMLAEACRAELPYDGASSSCQCNLWGQGGVWTWKA